MSGQGHKDVFLFIIAWFVFLIFKFTFLQKSSTSYTDFIKLFPAVTPKQADS